MTTAIAELRRIAVRALMIIAVSSLGSGAVCANEGAFGLPLDADLHDRTAASSRVLLEQPISLQADPVAFKAVLQPGDADAQADTTGDDDAADGETDGAEDGETATDYGSFQPIAELIEAGGPIIVILGVLSMISLAIILAKLIQFAVLRVWRRAFVADIIDLLCRGRAQEALEKAQTKKGVVARVLEAALRGRALGPDAEDVAREEVTRVAQSKLDGLESGLTFLRLIATISPLLGLLGTVLGMIEAFQELQSAGDRVDPAILSGGIWEALLTTAAGLSVAIPAAAFYTALQRTVEVTAQAMEDAATQCFTAPLYTQSSAKPPADDAIPAPAV